ncbi:MAG: DUF4870 domain-containing protein [Pseudonocardia sp.]|nr:DUF4870 domain-containing protein [Pseudonocardia sp.]
MTYPQYGGEPIASTTPEERNWALAAQFGSIVTAWFALGLIAPLIVLLVKGKELIAAYGVFWLICVIIATVRASQGDEFRYPLTLRLIS